MLITKQVCLFRRLGLNHSIYDLFINFLTRQRFSAIGFQQRSENLSGLIEIFICVLKKFYYLEQHEGQ